MKTLYVCKKKQFAKEQNLLKSKLEYMFDLKLPNFKLYDAYFLNTYDDEVYEIFKNKVIGDLFVNSFSNTLVTSAWSFAKIDHSGQFNVRVDAAINVFKLFSDVDLQLKYATFYDLGQEVSEQVFTDIKKYLINEIEASELKRSSLIFDKKPQTSLQPQIINNFTSYDDVKLKELKLEHNLSLSLANIKYIQQYKINEQKDLTLDELLAMDAYWSDHCRHETFNSKIKSIKVECSEIKELLDKTILELNKRNKDLTLMNVATLCAKLNIANLKDVVFSKEINCCLLKRNLNGCDHLFSFKNETHNHPSQIEPFGGAATCLGGAIRDILDMRSFAYQGYRLSGSGYLDIKNSQKYNQRLTQEQISLNTASGFSSYGNQIGLPTNYVEEIYHPSYQVKHLELGALMGTTLLENVKFSEPCAGDLIVVIGGRSGRDGIGGASGSSCEQKNDSDIDYSAQVQKGNAPKQRKLQKLFLKPQFCKLLKRVNDFGAGGSFVAISELASGVEVDLSKFPLKYLGLKTHEILISESQERLALVISAQDKEELKSLCSSEDVEFSFVGRVCECEHKLFTYKDKVCVNLKTSFVDSNGILPSVDVNITNQNTINVDCVDLTYDNVLKHLNKWECQNQKGLDLNFDNSVTTTTAMLSYGGKYQLTKAPASVHFVPTQAANKDYVSCIAHGFDPQMFAQNPFIGAQNALISTYTKLVALGCDYHDIRFSMQEYFPTCTTPQKFGNVMGAILGANKVFNFFKNGAIGGKDSMSGSWLNEDVVDTLISFGFTTCKSSNLISNVVTKNSKHIYMLKPQIENNQINLHSLQTNFETFKQIRDCNKLEFACEIENGGLIKTLVNICSGNKIGINIETSIDCFNNQTGTIIFATKEEITNKFENLTYLGTCNNKQVIKINDVEFSLADALKATFKKIENFYPLTYKQHSEDKINLDLKVSVNSNKRFYDKKLNDVKVLIAYFEGSNSEDDLTRSFEENGGCVEQVLIKASNASDINKSIEKFTTKLSKSHILVIPGGFSYFDEPDGSGKFIASFLNNDIVKKAIKQHLKQKHLILGICNGFQALVKSGLIIKPKNGVVNATLDRNVTSKHIACAVNTKVVNFNSPWTQDLKVNKVYKLPISHGEGNFQASAEELNNLVNNMQIASVYCQEDGLINSSSDVNLNGSALNIEGLISADGLILGKMAHSERVKKDGKVINYDYTYQNIFKSAINYFKGEGDGIN